MRVYNSLTGEKEDFEPLNGKEVKMYVCGPTVYDKGHLGHARSAVAFDVIRRYLGYRGYDVTYVSNYTDIDDKMIKRAEEEGISVKELADRIIPEYQKDYGDLGILPADISPLATEYVDAIIASINKLEENGFCYVIDGDGVYFEVEKFEGYGKLSNQNLEELKMGARVDVNDKKRSPYDFALWKFKKEGEPFWDSPWGEGRPGWHIECSAMVESILGDTIDIHGGGVDLKFPHHECEVAQHEGATGKLFVKYWMHNGFIRIDSEKMSKSLGNFFTIREILQEFKPMVVRLFLLQKNYRAPIDFTRDSLQQTENSYERIQGFLRRLGAVKESGVDEGGEIGEDLVSLINDARAKFENGMDDDFETPEALAALFEMIKGVNSILDEREISGSELELTEGFGADLDSVLGIFHLEDIAELGDDFMTLIALRNEARAEKDWAKADEIRDKLKNDYGVEIEDTAEGTRWWKV